MKQGRPEVSLPRWNDKGLFLPTHSESTEAISFGYSAAMKIGKIVATVNCLQPHHLQFFRTEFPLLR